MNYIITTDLHLTDRKQDEYRWGLFPWLKEQAIAHDVGTIFILGDLTDSKDRHSSVLVNRIVETLQDLETVAAVIVLCGNHDYIDPKHPFFLFFNRLKPYGEVGVKFINEIKPCLGIGGLSFCMLPHTRNPERDWADVDLNTQDFILMHQTLSGSVSSSGYVLEGLDRNVVHKSKSRIYAGDVHVPQQVGNVTYVGSPYHINFGDSFKPRVLLIKGETMGESNLFFPCLQKVTLDVQNAKDILDNVDLRENDQVKVRLHLERHSYSDWPRLKAEIIQACREKLLVLFGVEIVSKDEDTKRIQEGHEEIDGNRTMALNPKDILDGYCKSNDISEGIHQVGMDLLENVR